MPEITPKAIPVVREVAQLAAQSDVSSIRPLKDWVAIRLEERPTHYGLIEIPKTVGPNSMAAAVVVKCGPGTDKAPMTVEVGQRVLVKGDPGYELPGGIRMLRVGALESELPAGVEVG